MFIYVWHEWHLRHRLLLDLREERVRFENNLVIQHLEIGLQYPYLCFRNGDASTHDKHTLYDKSVQAR